MWITNEHPQLSVDTIDRVSSSGSTDTTQYNGKVTHTRNCGEELISEPRQKVFVWYLSGHILTGFKRHLKERLGGETHKAESYSTFLFTLIQ